MLSWIDSRTAQTVGLHDGLRGGTMACSQNGKGIPRVHYVRPPGGGRQTKWSWCERRRPSRCRCGPRCPGSRRDLHNKARGWRQRGRRSGRQDGHRHRSHGGQRRLSERGCGQGRRSHGRQRCLSGSRPDNYQRRLLLWRVLIGQQKATKYCHQNHSHDEAGGPEAAEPICEIVAALVLSQLGITQHACSPSSSQRVLSPSAMGRI